MRIFEQLKHFAPRLDIRCNRTFVTSKLKVKFLKASEVLMSKAVALNFWKVFGFSVAVF